MTLAERRDIKVLVQCIHPRHDTVLTCKSEPLRNRQLGTYRSWLGSKAIGPARGPR